MIHKLPDDVVIDIDGTKPGQGSEAWIKGLRGWPYEDVHNANQMRAKLKYLGWPVEDFKASVLYQRWVDRLPWLSEV